MSFVFEHAHELCRARCSLCRTNPLLFPKTLTTVVVGDGGSTCRLTTYRERRAPRYPPPAPPETRARTAWMEDHVQGPCFVNWAEHEAWRAHRDRRDGLRSHPLLV